MGTATTRVVVGEFLKGEKNPKIIGVGEAETHGLRHGYVAHSDEVVASIRNAISQAEKSSNIKIKRAVLGVGGMTLSGDISTGLAIVSKADGEVTNLDIDKAMEDCEGNLNLGNKRIIQSFPVSYRLDGKEVWGRPTGMRGTKLEIKALFITCSAQHLDDLLLAVTMAGVEVLDVIPSPIAASHIALSQKQKIVGGALVDIGAETTNVAVFENEALISLHSFSIGSVDITNDIALGLKIPLQKAESLKLGNATEDYPRRKFDEIVEARLSDIFELIDNHFKKIKRSELLPAGVVFIGGGSNIPNLVEYAKTALNLPAEIGSTEIFGNAKTKLRDTSWFTALGLLQSDSGDMSYGPEKSFRGSWKSLKNSLKSTLRQLLP